MPKVSVYLSNIGGVDYSDEVRAEYEYDTISTETLEQAKQRFLNSYGRKWNAAIKQAVISEYSKYPKRRITRETVSSGRLTIKIVHKGERVPIIIVKDYHIKGMSRLIITHIRRPPVKYTREMDAFIVRNRESGLKYTVAAFNKIYGQNRSIVSIRDRRARIDKRKR